MRKFTFSFLFIVILCSASFGQQHNFWTFVDESAIGRNLFTKSQRPQAFKIFQLNEAAFKSAMAQAPSERIVSASHSGFVVSFPLPDGNVEQFRVVDAPVMAPELATRYPGINSYAGQGIEDPSASIRFDVSMHGVHATILATGKSPVYIDQLDGNYYRVVRRSDMTDTPNNFTCLTENRNLIKSGGGNPNIVEDADDGRLRTYRLAMISSAEFSNFFIPVPLSTHADSIAAVLAAQNSHLTRCNQVYEADFGVRMVLVANNDLLIYFNPATDPVNNPNNPSQGPLQAAIDGAIGSANYDIGHTECKSTSFNNNNGNAGCIACVCSAGIKGLGFSSYNDPSLLEFFVIDYLTHEMGHQFGANHTFTFSNEGTNVQVETGSGVTIMGYAGITGVTDVAPHSIAIFHSKSIEQVTNYIKSAGGSCSVNSITGNTAPTANAGVNYTIPRSTPFMLSGSGSDIDAADVLNYCWEQIDNRAAGFSTIPSPTATAGPQFRDYLPTLDGKRTIPILSSILDGTNGNTWEVLPSVARVLNFRLMVKDNHVGGGNNKSANMVLTISGTTGPFLVTAPNTPDTWNTGSSQTVTWSVNGTDGAPVNCANVKISYSSDGGLTFPIVLAASTPNDGSEIVIAPGIPTATARIKVEAVGNIFFDISNTNFSVAAPLSDFSFASPAPTVSACPAGAFMDITLGTISNLGFSNPITLTASGAPAGTVVSFLPSNIVLPGNSVTVRLTGTNTLTPGSYIITITGTASGAPTKTRNITYTINPGAGPVITSHPASLTVCAGSPASFSVVSSGTYQWQLSLDGGANWNNIPGAIANSYTIPVTTATMNNNRYRVVVAGQCGSTISGEAILTVHQLPTIVLTASPFTSLLPGQSTTLTATAGASTGGILTITWIKDGLAFVNTTNTYVVNVTNLGSYQVRIDEIWPGNLVCSNLSQVVTIDASPSQKLFIFPSPNDGVFTVSYFNSTGASTNRTVTIYDSKGSKVYFAKFPVVGPYTLISVNVRPALTGIYYIVVGDDAGKKLADGRVMIH